MTKLDTHQTALQKYTEVLHNETINLVELNFEMINLIDTFPLFFPPYLEVLELIEKTGIKSSYEEFLQITNNRLTTFLSGASGQSQSEIMEWHHVEQWALTSLLHRLEHRPEYTNIMRLVDPDIHSFAIKASFSPPSAGPSLQSIVKNLPVNTIAQAFAGREHLWYTNLAASDEYYFGCLLLKNNTYRQTTLFYKEIISKILEILYSFATKESKKLGEIVIQSIRPQGVIYRHIPDFTPGDSELYYLIIQSSNRTLLQVGTSSVIVQAGEIWKCPQTLLTKSYNLSDQRSIFVLFKLYESG